MENWTIKQLKDLIIGEEYYLSWSNKYNGPFWRVIFLGCINEFENGYIELYVAQIKYGKFYSSSVCYALEIGIGQTKKEAKFNYGRFKYDNFPNVYKSLDECSSANDHLINKIFSNL